MCNAANHSPSCNCGWGGEYHGGGGYGKFWRTTSFSHTVLSSISPSKAAIGDQPAEIRDAETYATSCWWCGAPVFYHTNGYGDSVLFDSLGYPWQVHACWEEYRRGSKSLRSGLTRDSLQDELAEQFQRIEQYSGSGRLSSYQALSTQAQVEQYGNQRMAILAGVISLIRFIPDEFSVANQMGITVSKLRRSYGDLYFIDRSCNGIKLKNIRQIQKAREEKKRAPHNKVPLQILEVRRKNAVLSQPQSYKRTRTSGKIRPYPSMAKLNPPS